MGHLALRGRRTSEARIRIDAIRIAVWVNAILEAIGIAYVIWTV